MSICRIALEDLMVVGTSKVAQSWFVEKIQEGKQSVRELGMVSGVYQQRVKGKIYTQQDLKGKF